jgi:uncharacterized protein
LPEVGQGSEGALALARAALAALEASRQRIDDLNVYPVPDGDTGTNMTETARAIVSALERGETDVVRASLMGARGNSGVILSQIVRGAVEALPEGEITPQALAQSLRGASDAAYAAVRNPQEGTMLTVIRELAEQAEELAAAVPLDEALPKLVDHGEVALARTPEQLDVLRQAGVVDAGGAGVVEILRGIAAHVRGEPLPEGGSETGALPLEAVHMEPSKYRYCTSFFVEGDAVDPEDFEAKLSELGDSLLVVGAPGAVKAHVHTDEPGRALALATAAGEVEEVDIKNMHVQTAQRTQRLEREAGVTGAVAVVVGNGNRRLFESLGAVCVDGGETMNPSTADIAAAIESLPDSGAIVLPNSKNVRTCGSSRHTRCKPAWALSSPTTQSDRWTRTPLPWRRPRWRFGAAPLPGPPGALRSARSRSSRASSSASWKGSRCRPAPHSIRLHARSSTGS